MERQSESFRYFAEEFQRIKEDLLREHGVEIRYMAGRSTKD